MLLLHTKIIKVALDETKKQRELYEKLIKTRTQNKTNKTKARAAATTKTKGTATKIIILYGRTEKY